MAQNDDMCNWVKAAAVPSDGGGPTHVSQPGVVWLLMRLLLINQIMGLLQLILLLLLHISPNHQS